MRVSGPHSEDAQGSCEIKDLDQPSDTCQTKNPFNGVPPDGIRGRQLAEKRCGLAWLGQACWCFYMPGIEG